MDDDDVDTVTTDIWSYFEKLAGGKARCVVCRASVSNKPEELKTHLRSNHPKLISDIDLETDNENIVDAQGESYTEVIYLEDTHSKKSDGIAPLLTQFNKHENSAKQDRKPRSDTNKRRRRRSSSSTYEVLPKKFKYDEEIDKFAIYITCLLKSLPYESRTKLQMDIINMIMKEKLEGQRRNPIMQNVHSGNLTELENEGLEIIKDGNKSDLNSTENVGTHNDVHIDN